MKRASHRLPKQLLIAVLCVSGLACSRDPEPSPAPDPAGPETPGMEPDFDLPVILAFGDSLTAGYGVDREASYPVQLQEALTRNGYAYTVVNQGQDGDTTSGGVARLPDALALEPEIVILELGGNDGLRGIPVEVARENLRTMIEAFQLGGTRVILAGMTLPPNYGPDYIRSFESIYTDLARELGVVLIPFLLEGLIEQYERYIQSDGIHPTAEGYTIVSATVFDAIEPYLTKPVTRGD